uniref:protein REVEILLE 6 n=1 Tax=Erigeron canadensis TaxID=72917 RepID=UPI001CB8EF5C|nr:protein REVEILLE 6 [Erigeron canadensis]
MGFDSVLPAPVSKESNYPITGGNNNNSVLEEEEESNYYSSNKGKIRKPYTITKSRQNWTDVEHDKFLEALHLFDRDWKKIEAFVASKTAIQIRSHAQKYFLKVQKNGANEHVPPPRPKKKAAHPYPLKAPKQDVCKVGGTQHPAADIIKNEDIIMKDASLWPTQDDVISSSIDSGTGIWPSGETNDKNEVKQRMFGRVIPDFPKVYRFIGGIFDPNESNHMQKLKMMDPVDVETVVLLMRNLCANLKSPQFEDYAKEIISSYDPGTGKVASNSSFGGLDALPGDAILSS